MFNVEWTRDSTAASPFNIQHSTFNIEHSTFAFLLFSHSPRIYLLRLHSRGPNVPSPTAHFLDAAGASAGCAGAAIFVGRERDASRLEASNRIPTGPHRRRDCAH